MAILAHPPDDRPALVVPDIHQDAHFFERCLARARTEGAVLVFLGDYVDSINPRWQGPAALKTIANALIDLALSPDLECVLLVGNHDLQALTAARVRASWLLAGQTEQVERLDAALPQAAAYAALLATWPIDFLSGWHIASAVHGYLLTHAGVARRFWPWAAGPDRDTQFAAFRLSSDAAWQAWLRNNRENPLFDAGPGRGGRIAPVGGPLWLDWDTEFVDDLPLPQIVGHTRGREPRRKDRSWCIDTAQTHAALLDPDRGLRIFPV